MGRGRRRAGLLGESGNGSRPGRRRDPRKRLGVIRAVPLISDRKSVSYFVWLIRVVWKIQFM